MTKENTYNALIMLTLVSFGFFGSLSHLFSLALIILTIVDHTKSDKKNNSDYKSILLFCILSGSFFLFFLTSLFHSDLKMLLKALSPMLPIPLIGLLVIYHNRTDFNLSSKKVAQFSKISVLFSLTVYVVLLAATNADSRFYDFYADRLSF